MVAAVNCGGISTVAQRHGPALLLTPCMVELYEVLRDGRLMTHYEVIDALWGHREDGGPLHAINALRVRRHRLEKRLRPFGLRVEASKKGLRLVQAS